MSSPLRRLNPLIWKYRNLVVPGLIFSILSAGFSLAVPMVVRQAVDAIPRMVHLYQMSAGTPQHIILYNAFGSALVTYGLAIVALSLGGGISLFLTRQTVVVASRHIEYDLRNEFYSHLQRLTSRFFQNYATGDVITRSTSDIEQVRRYVGPALMYATRSIVMLISALTVMIIISPKLTFYAVSPMPILAVLVWFVSTLIHKRSQAVQKQYAVLTSLVQEIFSGIRVIKAYTREKYEAAVFDKESINYKDRSLDLVLIDAGFRPIFLLLIGVSTLIVVWAGGIEVMEGTLTIGNIAEYIIYVALLTWPVASLGFIISMIQRAAASADRLHEVLDTVPDISDGPEVDHSITNVSGKIAFKNVSYQYQDTEIEALKNISFEIEAGKTLALVGQTGSGKSTFIEMVMRLLEPNEGVIEIDGKSIKNIPLTVLRSKVGYVPQEVFLFSDTVGNNIAFGRLDATDDDIKQAALEADLLENIDEFENGFETMVGERGITLSGGQKQRTSIARAIIRRPAILILDDALSAVDTHTESNILGHLRKESNKRTMIIVSHRISAVQDADLILVLEDGEITARGSHDDLVGKSELYAEMHRKQLLEKEIEGF